ncbi:hypothetical protein SAMN05216199_2898 [Pedococcus cremeus]|uniref:AMIN-like domain-containing protein n=1 Tax=Pedococcus cremeus TaxID=587636 RepID=A0A1H9WGP4_9MICO|nr:hypothetical protein [Pedococcus cremeus]SES33078.1 hypothetical protein SAMN05216199_2898 [Pedococcus cremeus]
MPLTSRAVVRPLLLALVVGTVPLTAAAATASTPAATPYCGIRWGSLAKTSSTSVAGPITNVRSGRHACYDRLVIDLKGKAPGYTVKYVNTFTGAASGLPIPLRGGAKLSVTVNAPAYTPKGTASYTPAHRAEVVDVTGYRTFRQVRWDSSFEGQTQLGLGVRARLPFRVFTLQDATTSRLVIDVAHHW